MSDFIVFGGINMDLFAYLPRSPEEGETIEANSIEFFLGGKGANQAVALARLGAKVSFVGTVGKDLFGQDLESLIERENVNIKNLSRKKGQSGVALINVLEDGRNEVVAFPGINKNSKSKQVSNQELEACSIVIGTMELEEVETSDLFKRAKQNNCLTILNLAPYKEPSKLLLEQTDILVVNETEFLGLLNKTPQSVDIDFIDKNFSSLNIPSHVNVVITLGDSGVIAYEKGKRKYFKSRKVKAIDTVGAGDCFVGALGFSLSENPDMFSAVKFANCAASLSVTKKGAAKSMPSYDEVVNKL